VTIAVSHLKAIATAVPPYLLHQSEVAERAGAVFTGRGFDRLARGYRRALGWALSHRPIIVVTALALLAAGLGCRRRVGNRRSRRAAAPRSLWAWA
jgi:multidrug efflux pump subunit AcrB